MSLDGDLRCTNFGLHGTTAIACTYKDGGLIAVECRSSNEKRPKKNLKIKDNVRKCYKISSHVKGVMLGDRDPCITMAEKLMEKCVDMNSVSSVFKAAEAYIRGFKGQQMQFGTIICGYDAKGFQIEGVYVNGEDVVVITDIQFLSLGTGRKHAKKMAEKLMSLRNEARCNANLPLDFDEALDIVLRSLFDATFRDYLSGGFLCVYRLSNGIWEHIRTLDILDAYATYYNSYEEGNILFLLVNCVKAENLCANDLLTYFRQYGAISVAHRVAEIRVTEKRSFYFHRLVCDRAEDASQILSHVMEAGTYAIGAAVPEAIKEILKAFPHRVEIDHGTLKIPLYVNRASKGLLNLLQRSCNIKTSDLPPSKNKYPTIDTP